MSLTNPIGIHSVKVTEITKKGEKIGVYERSIYPKGDGFVMFFQGRVREVNRDEHGHFNAKVDLRETA